MDIILAVALFFVTSGTAYLGVRVTLHPAETPSAKRSYKLGFLVLTLCAAGLIVSQSLLNRIEQGKLHAQLDKIQKNTEQPPKVELQIPSMQIPSPPRQRAIIAAVRNTEGDAILFFKDPQHPDQGWLMNVWCKNIGPIVAKNVSCRFYEKAIAAEHGIPKRDVLIKEWTAYKHSPVSRQIPGDDLSPNDARFGTTPLGTSEIPPALNSGELVIFVAGAMWYGDDAGGHKKEFCAWAQPPFSFPHAVWHSCEIGHNREVY